MDKIQAPNSIPFESSKAVLPQDSLVDSSNKISEETITKINRADSRDEDGSKFKDNNSGSDLNKYGNLVSAFFNIFSGTSLLSSVLSGYKAGENTFLGNDKDGTNPVYDKEKLSNQNLALGEKLGWLSYKYGALFNALGTFAKNYNIKNTLGTLGSLISVLAVPTLDKILGTLLTTVGFSLTGLGMSREGEADHIKNKDTKSIADLFNFSKVKEELKSSWHDALEFMKHPIKNFPLKKDAKTKLSMNFISIMNMITSIGGLFGLASSNTFIRNTSVIFNKITTTFEAFTQFVQSIKEKRENSKAGTGERQAAWYQSLAAGIYTIVEPIYDTKLGKALTAIGSGFFNLQNVMMSLNSNEYQDQSNANSKHLFKLTQSTGFGAIIVGLSSGLLLTAKKMPGVLNALFKAIEFSKKR